jgi:glycosyltransferase involved in cell wall biosynthesis
MVMPSPSTSLIVATYNWPEALNLCLTSILNQTLMPDEIIIADDGSSSATGTLIESYRQQFKVPLIHVWQKDEGFQLSKIRNKAIAEASKDYIIQIDGDLILEKHFVKDHLDFSKPGTFVSGTRIQMSPKLSGELLQRKRVKVSVFSKGITNLSNGIRLSFLSRFLAGRYKARDLTYVRGCNMAFWRTDLLEVNGYNESIKGWGREDSELAIRLINSGKKKNILKFGAAAFHIYHPEVPRQNLRSNDMILENTIEKGIRICETGLNQYL